MKCKKIPWLQVFHKERLLSPQQQALPQNMTCTSQLHTSHFEPQADSSCCSFKRKRQTKSTAWDQPIRQELVTLSCNSPLPKECTLPRGIITAIADFSTTYSSQYSLVVAAVSGNKKSPDLDGWVHLAWYKGTRGYMSNQESDFQQTMHLTCVCLKASQELYLTQNLQLRKGEINSFSHFVFLLQVAPASEG